MARLFPPDKWQKLCEIEYVGYQIMEAQVRADGSIILGRAIESYPDARWDLMARALGQQVRLHPDDAGTHLDAKAEIYVVFFPSGWDGNLALIFGQQSGGVYSSSRSRPACLSTTRY